MLSITATLSALKHLMQKLEPFSWYSSNFPELTWTAAPYMCFLISCYHIATSSLFKGSSCTSERTILLLLLLNFLLAHYIPLSQTPHIPRETSEHDHFLFMSWRQWGKYCICIRLWFQCRHKRHPRIHKVQHQPKQRTPIPNANEIPFFFFFLG